MAWLALVVAAFAAAIWAAARRASWAPAAAAAGYAALAAFILAQAGGQAFSGSETSLLGYFVAGPAVLAASELLAVRKRPVAWLQAAAPLAALLFASGFDILRPDAYALVPASILAALFALVGVQAYRKLQTGLKKKAARRPLLAAYVAAVAILLYAALFKTVDRGWLLPTAYGAGVGAVLFAASQLWLGWERVMAKPVAPAWAQRAALHTGVVLMTVAAFFVYREFL